jgi:hypothetical protein
MQQLLVGDEKVPVDDTDWRLHGLIVGDGTFIQGKNV